MLHRWLQIGRPERDAKDPGPDLSALANLSVPSWGMEVSRSREGRVHFRLLAPDADSLSRVSRVLDLTFPHVSVLGEAPCVAPSMQELSGWRFARARPTGRHHYWPLNIPQSNDRWMTDYQETLVSILGNPSLGAAEVRLQLLAKKVGAWEAGLFSSRYDKLVLGLQGQHDTLFNGSWKTTPTPFDLEKLKRIEKRRATAPFHIEVRAAWNDGESARVLTALRPWLAQWTSFNGGGTWRWFDEVRAWPLIAPRRLEGFARAFAGHDLDHFAVRREARDVSADELATMLAPLWRRWHAALGPVPSPTPSTPTYDWRRRGPRPRGPVSPIDFAEDERIIAEIRASHGLPPAPPRLLPPVPASTTASMVRRNVVPLPVPALPGWTLGVLADHTLRLPPDWRHLAIVGGTGTGKSTLLLNVILQAISDPRAGTVVVLDPTGALVRAVKTCLSLVQARDSVEFDPSQLFFTQKGEEWVAPGFNLLDVPPEVRSNPAAFDRASSVVISDLIRSFHDAWGTESVGARAGYFMTALLKGLMRRPGTTLLDVRDVIVNKEARERYTRWLPPGSVFEGSFAKEELPKYRIEDFVSTLDKTGWFGGSHTLRGALCQRQDAASFQSFLGHRLVLLNVSRGLVGDQNCRILGSAFLSMLWSERLAHGEGAPPLTVVIDEAQTFALPSLSQMLSEGRKYGVRVVLANQYFGQLPQDLRASMEGNVDTWCCFRVGSDDARAALKVTQASQWEYTETRFVSLPSYQFVCNQLTHSNQGFWQTLPPPPASPEALSADRLIRENTQKYSARETSGASPFLVDQETLGPVVYAVSEGTSLREDIAEELEFSRGDVFAALRRGEDLGYVTWDPRTKENRVTPLGQAFVDAWGARRVTESEGELHMDLLARAVDYIRVTWGVEVDITPQGANPRPLPDGTFEQGGIPCNLEVECTTLATKGPQVAKNLRKAREQGRRCLFVVQSMEHADRLIQVVRELAPEAKLAADFAILYGGDGRFSALPKGMSADGFPFVAEVEKGIDKIISNPDNGIESPPTTPRASKRGADLPVIEIVRGAVRSLLEAGKDEAESEEIIEAMPKNFRGRFISGKTGRVTPRLGPLLAKLGIPYEMKWNPEKGYSVRTYQLRAGAVPSPAAQTSAGPSDMDGAEA